MLKKIRSEQLREGMFVDKLDGSWLSHPFWRKSFLIREAKDIDAIRASGIAAVWIDTARGLDVLACEAQSPGLVELVDDIALDQRCAADANAPAEMSRQPPAAQPLGGGPRKSLREELARASRIYAGSKPVLQSMFAQVRLGRTLDTAQARELVEDIAESLSSNPWALISLARLKTADDYTYLHSVAVCALMIALARQVGLDEPGVREAGLAGMLHDIGKAKMPHGIINKPGKLTEAEFEIIKTHPAHGHALLLEMGGIAPGALDVCLHHHEKIDGSGYPFGLAGDQISQLARMGALCDVYDAVTSNRPYKAGWDPAESVRRMAGWAPGHFDPTLFQMFVKSVGIYPIGSLVRLESGLVGVVIDQGADSLLTPQVRVLLSAKTQAPVRQHVVDLARPGCADRIAGLESPARWGLSDLSEYL